jgi:VWFA-related protein
MKFFPTAIVVLIGCVVSTAAQTPTPRPTPPDTDVVKISTNLVQVDVTVIDKSGNVVRDLRPDEIEIYQNGKKQDITNFSFISNTREINEKQKVKPQTQTPGPIPPPTPVKAENVKRTIALVVAGLSFQSMSYVRRALRKFVDESMQEGDLVAIVRTNSASGVLQQFTTDKRLLRAAIDEIRFDSFRNSQLAFAPITQSNAEPSLKAQQDRDKEDADFQETKFISATLEALNFIVRGMQDLPGRKSVMLLSDGFPLIIGGPGSMMIDTATVIQNIRRVVDSANRASVIINTMDARGLVDTGFATTDNLTDSRGFAISGEAMLGAIGKRNQKVVDYQRGPEVLAEQTGGVSIFNNNDLSGGIRKILDDQSYYLIGYQPDDDTFNPKVRPFHRLQVKVKRSGVNVRYRSGFFGVSDEKVVKPEMTSGQRLVTALLSPFAVNEIPVRLNAIFNNDQKQGSHIRSLVHVEARNLKFTDGPDGTKIAVFDVIAAGIDENGNPVDTVNQSYTLTANKPTYEKYMADGFVYGFTFPIKSPGVYQLRVALRDRGSDQIGSANQLVEVPDIGQKRLALSGVYMENLSLEDWKIQNTTQVNNAATHRQSDMSRRRFKRGTVLNYAFVIFNAKLDRSQRPSVTVQIGVFCDGKPVVEGSSTPVSMNGQTDMQRIGYGGSLNLGDTLPVGDYVLQITAQDTLAKEKQQTKTQFVQFEIIE